MKRRGFLAASSALPLSYASQMSYAATPSQAGNSANPLLTLLSRLPRERQAVAREPRFELQLMLSRIERRAESVTLSTHTHGVAPTRWFAPASLVKLPVAMLALERIQELGRADISADTPLRIVDGPPCAKNGMDVPESVARAIRRIMVVSENEPYNRLYDFLGADRIHTRLAQMGCPMSRVVSRIAACSVEANRSTGASEFLNADGSVLARLDAAPIAQARRFPHGAAMKGRGWMEGGALTPGPRDFSERNFMPLTEMHRLLIAAVLPEALREPERAKLRASDHAFLRQTMSMLPAASTDPRYDARDFSPTYSKYLVGGAGLLPALPAGLTIANKVGRSFGYLIDCAYFNDATNEREFFLSASVYVNEDDTLNDGKYEYREVGYPFMAALGRAALAQEAATPRAGNFARLQADGRFST